MVKKQQNAGVFGLIFCSPIIFIGISALTVFYILCFFKNTVLPLFVFCPAVLSLIAFFAACRFKKKLPENFKYILAGIFTGFIAFFNLLLFFYPPLTLAKTDKVDCIKVRLIGEPYPSGSKYYSVNAKLLNCKYQNGAEFSANGNIKVFFPTGIILQNKAGEVSVYKSDKKNAAKFFSKGVILSVKGKFIPKKSSIEPLLFFSSEEVPEFLGWDFFLSSIRATMRFNLMRLLADWGGAGGLLLALLSSNKEFLEISCSSAFRNSGLSHVLALSGMHVSLISLLAIRLGSLSGRKSFAIKFSLFSIIFFVWFAGSAPSLNRALGMMIILILGKSLGLKPDIFSILNTMLVLHILFKPYDALSLGFMLSYGALAGILLFGTAIFELLRGKLPSNILGGLSASIAAQAFTAPIVIAKIGVLAPIGIIASIVISPVISAFLIIGIPSVFLSFIFPQTSFIFSYLLNLIYSFIVFCVENFARFPLAEADGLTQKLFFAITPFCLGLAVMYYSDFIKKKRLGL